VTTDRQAGLEALHERLVDEVRKIRTGADWKAWLDAAAKLHTYSFRNILLITRQRPDATTVAGYTTWKKLGRQVNKGEKGIEIFAPVTRPRARNTAAPDLDTDSVPSAGAGSRRMVGVRRTHVWDISQTSGAELPRPPAMAELDGTAPEGLWDNLAKQVSEAGYTLEREQLPEGAEYGYTHHPTRRIVVADRLGPVDAVATLAHEVAHMHMHDPSGFAEATTRSCRGVREVEAESVAYLIAAHHGLPTDRASFPYVATWAARSDKTEPEHIVQETGQRVVATARRILASMTDQNLHDDRQAPALDPHRSASRVTTPQSSRPTRRHDHAQSAQLRAPTLD
jgi:DNA primase